MEKNSAPLLEMRNIKKDFFGNQVLTDINLTLREGEVLGLVGENGAGKSTLMKILFGMDVIRETGGYEGDILLNGEKVKFSTPFDALEAGIGMVHQEFMLLPDLVLIFSVNPGNKENSTNSQNRKHYNSHSVTACQIQLSFRHILINRSSYIKHPDYCPKFFIFYCVIFQSLHLCTEKTAHDKTKYIKNRKTKQKKLQ